MPHRTCTFCDIAQGRHATAIVHETRNLLVFADHAPIRSGHLQIIPRAHFTCFDDLPPRLAGQIMRLGQVLARALKAEYGVARVGFVFTGNDIAHAHAHLVPLVASDDITSRRYFANATVDYVGRPREPISQLYATADALRRRLEAQKGAG